MFVPAASLVLALIAPAFATPGRRIRPVCSRAPYSDILPFSNFPPAEEFCSLFFPVKPVTTTLTTTPLTTTTVAGPSPVTKRGTPAKSSEWQSYRAKLSRSGIGYLSTACSCIETASTITMTTTAPTSTTTMTTTPTACSPHTASGTTIFCGTRVSAFDLADGTPFTATAFHDCITSCASNTDCCAANYATAASQCTLLTKEFQTPCPTFEGFVPDADYDALFY